MDKYAKQLIAKLADTFTTKAEVSLSNQTPILTLTCHECGLVKKSSEEMEVHIKTEHIQWLPYKCPHCSTHRASDAMMREHIHAAHKQQTKEFLYVDNLEAKRKLQFLMDQALYATVTKKIGGVEEGYDNAMSPEASTAAHSTTSSDSPPAEPSSPFTDQQEVTAQVEIRTGGNSNTDALLASITRQAVSSTTAEDSIIVDVQSLLDALQRGEDLSDKEGRDDNGQMDKGIDMTLFQSLFGEVNGHQESNETPNKKNTSQQSKKKVVGYCKACNKAVTAGARQMHLFFHLAKDEKIYRFYCKFDNCDVEHYRKDQMEHHMTKIHGNIEPDLIGDRTDQLYSRCKELQHELLGEMSAVPASGSSESSTPTTLKRPANPIPSTMPLDDKQCLQCKLCKKFMENRVKGFHILYHLSRDKGILRYTCKMCDFAHDRSQSVLGHGKKEHGREDVVLDRIADYEEEVQEMSMNCFGFDTNFETSKKKAKGSAYIEKKPKEELLLNLVEPQSEDEEDSNFLRKEDDDEAME